MKEIKFKEYSYFGNPLELLKALLRNYVSEIPNLDYTLFRNQLRIFDRAIGTSNQPFTLDSMHPEGLFVGLDSGNDSIVRINKNAGMILSPETEDLGQGRFLDDRLIKVKTIFNPELQVGGVMNIKSKRYNGRYIISNIRHNCDNWER